MALYFEEQYGGSLRLQSIDDLQECHLARCFEGIGLYPTPERHFRREPAWTNHVETHEPVDDRELSGLHYWDADRIAHDRDAPAFCPGCGEGFADLGSIAVEYWEKDRRVYYVRCGQCDWTGDIVRVERLVGPDAPH